MHEFEQLENKLLIEPNDKLQFLHTTKRELMCQPQF